MRVLIADDSDAIVQRLTTLLADMGGVDVVGRAGTVAEAAAAARDLAPDLVILDMHMPGGTGLDVLEGLRRDRVPAVVVVLTNHPYPQYRERCLAAGARLFLDKTSGFHQVRDVVESLLRESSSGSAGGGPE